MANPKSHVKYIALCIVCCSACVAWGAEKDRIFLPDPKAVGKTVGALHALSPSSSAGKEFSRFPTQISQDIDEATGVLTGFTVVYGDSVTGKDLVRQIEETEAKWRYEGESMDKLGLALWRNTERRYVIQVTTTARTGTMCVVLWLDRKKLSEGEKGKP